MNSELITMSPESPLIQQDANVITTTESTSSSIVVKKDKCTSAVWNDFTKFDNTVM